MHYTIRSPKQKPPDRGPWLGGPDRDEMLRGFSDSEWLIYSSYGGEIPEAVRLRIMEAERCKRENNPVLPAYPKTQRNTIKP